MRALPRLSSFPLSAVRTCLIGISATAFSLVITGCYKGRVVGLGAFLYGRTDYANVFLSIIFGAAVGAFFSQKARKFRKYFGYAILALLALAVLNGSPPWVYVGWFLIAAVVAWQLLKIKGSAAANKPTTFGSAEWADRTHILTNKLTGSAGLWLGTFADGEGQLPLQYTGDRHLLTVAPTRAGKGVSAIIPNLLTYTGSAIVIDPKGENALIAASQRKGVGRDTNTRAGSLGRRELGAWGGLNRYAHPASPHLADT